MSYVWCVFVKHLINTPFTVFRPDDCFSLLLACKRRNRKYEKAPSKPINRMARHNECEIARKMKQDKNAFVCAGEHQTLVYCTHIPISQLIVFMLHFLFASLPRIASSPLRSAFNPIPSHLLVSLAMGVRIAENSQILPIPRILLFPG